MLGAERIDTYLPLLQGKRVGLTINQSSRVGETRLIDTLLARKVQVVRAFGPEHGVNGQTAAATDVDNSEDPQTHTPFISLFGKQVKPPKEDIADIDIMVFDMQDVGVRFYTYISTLHYVMEACAESGIPLLLLDRPNPNDGYIDGPVREANCSSFIGMHPIPIVHGMTLGEYAQMINGQHWLKNGIQCNLKVITMQHYRHGMGYTLPIAPSPNLNTQRSVILYPSLCWFGGTIISDGRGTGTPFQLLGAPSLKDKYPFRFVPQPIPHVAERPMHMRDTCYGMDLRQISLDTIIRSKKLQLKWLLSLYENYPEKAHFFNGEAQNGPDTVIHFDLQAGTTRLRKQIKAGLSENEIRKSWQDGLEKFKKIREKYILYP
ncbi:DUF1343 domain-containing protein [Olivibacter ginsenosidimutans]|uniref:DUF1343 domain-containing protein n=1 Tax=Olivibacter ginsenosidimutans TaxID=1176537 RepID=A0ABP9AVN2_9SPHI